MERANRDVENIVAVWKRDNNRSDWASALPIIQYTKNARHHTGIGRSPYKAMFGKEAALGVEHLNLESSLAKHVANEEDLTTMFPQVDFCKIMQKNVETAIARVGTWVRSA